MRYSIMVAGLVAGLLATPVLAEMKIAVADSQMALMASDAAKKAVEKLQGELKVQRDRMSQLKNEIEGLDAKAKKDGAVMSAKDKQDLQKQAEGKIQEYNNLGQTIQRRTQEVQNELLQRMLPKMEAAIEELQKTNKFDIIIERKSAIFADPSVDITKKITEKLNAATAAGK
ncbi:MAG: OmpH family outer membrane protein [Moraxellaceae bacterium]|jgi:outer membrane protein|nr:OmpH family outer membrane protein [Moraxellaceae bacterium]